MYSKQEVSAIKRKFWTVFGQYMKPVLSASGETINWVNYKTGARNIFFRMEATTQSAIVSIEITHKDASQRKYFFEKFKDTQKIFDEIPGNDWEWREIQLDEHSVEISRISKELKNVNVLKETDWPAIISFLKQTITDIDKYWNLVKDVIVE